MARIGIRRWEKGGFRGLRQKSIANFIDYYGDRQIRVAGSWLQAARNWKQR
jgi:hypothetical protein